MGNPAYPGPIITNDSNSSGVSWGAVIAGAFAAASLSLILLALGTGIGFSAVSPWPNSGASLSMIGWTAVIWLILMQLISSSVAGYLAGRLRTKWINLHVHEVYFRDTAHGFLAWAVGLVIAAAFLASAATSLVHGAQRGDVMATNASGPAESAGGRDLDRYYVDELLRPGSPTPDQSSDTTGQVEIIIANALGKGALPPADKTYLAQIVAAKSGLSEPDAEKRVDDIFAQAQQAADSARKAIAHAMYWTFLALLIGAFCASLAATIGGSQRDRMPVI
jgi:hypothetical protein